MFSFGTPAISEKINWRFGPFVVAGFALAPVLVSYGRDGPRFRRHAFDRLSWMKLRRSIAMSYLYSN